MSRTTTRFKEVCLVPEGLDPDPTACGPTDQRCNDPEFSRANPIICGANSLELILRPAVSNILVGETVQYTTTIKINGVESPLTLGLVYSSANTNIATVNASTGVATGVEGGTTTITVTWHDLSAHAQLTVHDTCPSVAIAVIVNNSKSSSLVFGDGFATRLTFAKAMTTRFLNSTDLSNASVGIVQMNLLSGISGMSTDRGTLLNYVAAIPQSQAFTSIGDGIGAAIDMLAASTATQKVILLLSDGEQRVPATSIVTSPTTQADIFKSAGGILISIGLRASGDGFALLSSISTAGYFVNALPASAGATSTVASIESIMDNLREFLCHPCDPPLALVPFLTDYNVPSGAANSSIFPSNAWQVFDDDSGSPTFFSTFLNDYVQYNFGASGKTATFYRIIPHQLGLVVGDPTVPACGPKTWTLKGSNNGTVYTTLDTQTNYADWDISNTFTIASPASYSYYKLTVTAAYPCENPVPNNWEIQTLQLYGGTNQCTVDFFAPPVIDPSPLPDVEDTGGGGGNTYTVTKSFTACCPPNQVGDCVTRSATYTSTISQADADVHATALARSAAFAELSCCSSFPIQIVDSSGNTQPANPYPSCVKVEGRAALIGGLKVHVNGLSHTSFRDTAALLVGPTGQSVVLWKHCGTSTNGSIPNLPVVNQNFIFADSGGSLPGASFPGAGPIVGGTFKPTNFDANLAFPLPAPAPDNTLPIPGYSLSLADFIDTDPNGVWKLYVEDDLGLDSGSIVSWSLEIDDEILACDCTGTSPASLSVASDITAIVPCNTCINSAAPQWDGTGIDLVASTCVWNFTATDGTTSLNGTGLKYVFVELIAGPNSNCFYQLRFICYNGGGGSVWYGTKVGGHGIGPAGRYFRTNEGCSPLPAFIDLEEA